LLRGLLGWIPFSIGDLLYTAAILYFIAKVWKFLRILKARTVKEYLSHVLTRKLLRIVLGIYIAFNFLWGLNYNRLGISKQLGLDVQPYTTKDLASITGLLQLRLNNAATFVSDDHRKRLNRNKAIFAGASGAYVEGARHFAFLNYYPASIKPSLYSHIGHYFGFTGYYNPFTGEAQIKTTVPFFIKPFVATHEIGHQLGYAKENEANFVGFLACRLSPDPEFQYSVYYDMYLYAVRELGRRDSVLAKSFQEKLDPQVKKDNAAMKNYLRRSANPIEPFVSRLYDSYLRWNNQPNGKWTYDQVVAWLIAYRKKYGDQEI
jgi:hypothetical protein